MVPQHEAAHIGRLVATSVPRQITASLRRLARHAGLARDKWRGYSARVRHLEAEHRQWGPVGRATRLRVRCGQVCEKSAIVLRYGLI